jgi:hypothetical protein
MKLTSHFYLVQIEIAWSFASTPLIRLHDLVLRYKEGKLLTLRYVS